MSGVEAPASELPRRRVAGDRSGGRGPSAGRRVTLEFDAGVPTAWGEAAMVVGSDDALGRWNPVGGRPLRWVDGRWKGTVVLALVPPSMSPTAAAAAAHGRPFDPSTVEDGGDGGGGVRLMYKYAIRRTHGGVDFEGGDDREIYVSTAALVAGCAPGHVCHIELHDDWRPVLGASLYLRSAFRNILFHRDVEADARLGPELSTPPCLFAPPLNVLSPLASAATAVATEVGRVPSCFRAARLRLHVTAPCVGHRLVVAVVGSAASLGSWDPASAVWMSPARFPVWSASVAIDISEFPVQYKFLVVNPTVRAGAGGEGPSSSSTGPGGGGPDGRGDGTDRPLSAPRPPSGGGGAGGPGEGGVWWGSTTRDLAQPTWWSTVREDSAGVVLSPRVVAAAAVLGDAVPPHLALTPPAGDASPEPLPASTPVPASSRPSRMLGFAEEYTIVMSHNELDVRFARPPRFAGVAIPVFALRSSAGMGVGEFADLKLMVDWAVSAGLSLIQVLPVNDTTATSDWGDSYPYGAISVFALHPMYIRLRDIRGASRSIVDRIEATRKLLNRDPHAELDYESVVRVKLSLLRDVYREVGPAFFEGTEFRAFFDSNREWLQPYALFCVLRDLFGTANPQDWGTLSTIDSTAVGEMCSQSNLYFPAVGFWYFVQYHLHAQLTDVADYARARRVVLKGDLPIGVSRCSCEVWQYPRLFKLKTQMGAPPDAFAAMGQNWSFPTYDWDAHRAEGFAWWRSRLTYMARYFSALRVDHILGFFRMWQIPDHAEGGLIGHFDPSIPIARDDLERDGVWDFDRLTKPLIRTWIARWALTDDVFAQHCDELFLSLGHDYWELRPHLTTEKAVRDAYPLDAQAPIREGLFRLLGNVLLLRDAGDPNVYFPRFDLHTTWSYHELDDRLKGLLYHLAESYFFKRHEDMWRAEAMSKLPALVTATQIMVCGEDLGVMPKCSPGVLSACGILSLRVQRMPVADPAHPNAKFGIPQDYPYSCVCTTSSHDTTPLRAWWTEDVEATQQYFSEVLHGTGACPRNLSGDLATRILEQHLQCDAAWAIFPIQDLMSIDEDIRAPDPLSERINDPSNKANQWKWRMWQSLEDLLSERGARVTAMVRRLVEDSGRPRPY